MRLPLLLLLLFGCAPVDLDGDGYTTEQDCDDGDPDISPSATEICDGIDQNCNGSVDELATDAFTFYVDQDGDGFGQGSPFLGCSAPGPEWADRRGDCDDDASDIYPGAQERCDQRDEDCDGEVDEGFVCGEIQCDDGIDDDLDGLVDCADPDCDGACPETCGDGRDNDDNGDTDCADEACWGADACVEIACDDGLDGEADGLTDCEDPDCWSDPRCPGAVWRLTGGSLSVSRETTTWTEKDCDGPDCARGTDRVQEIQAFDVVGELVRELDGGEVRCPFRYDRGRFYSRIDSGVQVEELVRREAFRIVPGCGIDDARFLPRQLILVGDEVHLTTGEAWFVGDRFEASVREGDLEDPERTGRVVRDLAFWDPLRPAPALGVCREGVASVVYPDLDGDGLGAVSVGRLTCGGAAGPVVNGDCEDRDAGLPAGAEVCGNGVDDDCDRTAPGCDGPSGVADLGAAEAVWTGKGVPRVFPVGDLDGDGSLDVALGLPGDDAAGEDAGAVVLLLDGLTGGDLEEEEVWILGEAAGDVAGAAVVAIGDHGGDGRGDLLITAPGVVFDGAPRSGAAYVIADPLDGAVLSDAHATLGGPGLWLGTSAAALGDTDGDGLVELAIGAQTDDAGGTNAGSIRIFEGPLSGEVPPGAAASVLTGARNDILGDAVAGPGDVDGDGLADLWIGRRKASLPASEAGAAHLFLGPLPTSAALDEADATWTGSLADAWAGERVAAAGDVDGDGYRDLLVGAPRTWGVPPRTIAATGEVYLVAGGAEPADGVLAEATAVIRGDRIYDVAGASLAGASDLDGDGLHDIVIGAPGDDRGGPQAGVVAVFYGPVTGQLRIADADGLYRGLPGTQAGTWAGLPGDLDGDGYGEMLISGLAGDGSGRGRVFGVVGGPGW